MIATGWIDGTYPSAPPSAYASGGSLTGHKPMTHTGVFMALAPNGQVNIFDQYTGKSLSVSSYKPADWNVVISDQKYDPRSSASGVPAEGVETKAGEGNSTVKACGR